MEVKVEVEKVVSEEEEEKDKNCLLYTSETIVVLKC